jgi:hypothetical protein
MRMGAGGPGLTHNKFGCPIFATVSSSLRWAFALRANRFPQAGPGAPPFRGLEAKRSKYGNRL